MSHAEYLVRQSERIARELIGKVFGQLTVVSVNTKGNKTTAALFNCLCVCGGHATVSKIRLRSGHTTTCGCLVGTKSVKHRMSTSPTYKVWQGMWQRCTNPRNVSHEAYKNRTPVDRWKSFENFYADMGDRPTDKHTLERKDNELGYSPDNCCWATYSEQSLNKRNTRLISYLGVTKAESVWSEGLGFTRGTVRGRISRGWTVAQALGFEPKPINGKVKLCA